MTAPDDHAGVIAKPPWIYLGSIAVAIVLDAIWPVSLLPQPAQYWTGGAIILCSFAVAFTCFGLFRKAGTTVPTDTPSTALVARGPYRFSRNPIYLSMTVLQTGIAIAADNFWILAILVPVLLVMNFGVIVREERYLERAFGDEYRAYKASVRRWI